MKRYMTLMLLVMAVGILPAAATSNNDVLEPAADIVGATVISRDGDHFGRLEHLLVDPQTGTIAFGAVFGGPAAAGAPGAVVPWTDLIRNRDGSFTYVRSELALRGAPDYMVHDDSFAYRTALTVYEHYGSPNYIKKARELKRQYVLRKPEIYGMEPMPENTELVTANWFRNRPVKNQGGILTGKVSRIYVDPGQGMVVVLALDLDDAGERAIPWYAVQYNGKDQPLSVRLSQAEIESSRVLSENERTGFDPDAARSVYEQYDYNEALDDWKLD